MSAQVTVSLDGQSRTVPRGATVREVLDGARGRDVVAARVNGKLVDLSRAIEDDATLEPVRADSPEGLDVLRHSTAHLMAQAVQSLYPGTQVTIGPTIEDGFFYDFAPPAPFTIDDLPKIEARDARAGESQPPGRASRSRARRGDRDASPRWASITRSKS